MPGRLEGSGPRRLLSRSRVNPLHASLLPESSPPSLPALAALDGLRTAPILPPVERERLRNELKAVLGACEWFTIGVMAPTSELAIQALRRSESFLGWPPLSPANELENCDSASGTDPDGTAARDRQAVFLKGNQRTGTFLLRQEQGLGQGVLITGHNTLDPSTEGTWGPLPLDLFDQIEENPIS